MTKFTNRLFLLFCLFVLSEKLIGQGLPAGYPVLEESQRRTQLIDHSFDSIAQSSFLQRNGFKFPNAEDGKSLKFGIVPFRTSIFLNSTRPYWYSPNGMIPAKGLQGYVSGGAFISHKYFSIDFQPEINVAQNSAYGGYQGTFDPDINFIFYQGLRRGDQPETYGIGNYSRIGWGQSKVVGKLGAFEAGISTRNLWWGPGQWNALTFSNNAPGFAHAVIGTHRPAKTFFGSFEFQLISGFPKSKKYQPMQKESLNAAVGQKSNRDRYLNALTFSVSPKWIPGFSIGASRTVQTFADSVDVKTFIDVLPVFWGLTKQQVGSDLVGESDRGRDQQISVFFRYAIPKAGFEFYGEFGRRDHALNIRELTLNPEFARAYLVGFNKVFQLSDARLIQVRGEMTQQSQSINRIIRALYINSAGRPVLSTTPWHTNGTIGGFTSWDQAMGVGVGMGSNVQMLEVSLVEGYNKLGIYLERLPQHADFYDVGGLDAKGYEPWVDLTAGPVFDHRWKNLIFSGRMLFTYTGNYYWSQNAGPQDEFPQLNSKFSTSTQLNLIYLFNSKEK